MESIKRILSVLFRIAISIILLAFLFRQVDQKNIFETIKNADKPLLVFAFLVFFLNYILCLYRWEMLLKAVKIFLPLRRVIISFAGGVFFNLFLPSTIGGDLMRSLDLATHTKKPKEVLATVFLDRLSGYIGLTVLAVLALLFGWNLVRDRSVVMSVVIIVVVLLTVLLVLFNKFVYSKVNSLLQSPNAGKFRELIKDMHQEIHYFRNQKGVIVKNLFLSLLIQTINPLSFYIIALSLGIKLDFLCFLIFLPIIGAITLLPISIGGLGLRDATMIFFFAKIGLSRDLTFAMSLLGFLFILIGGALGGLIYVFTVRHRRLQHHQPSSFSSHT